MAALHCFHCSEPVRTGDRYRLEVDGEERRFCCPACQMVAETILGGGLQDYYRFRDEPAARPEEADDYSAYDEPLIQQQSVQRHGDGSLEVSLLIEGMHCAACVDRKSTRLNSSHVAISYAVFCLKKKKETHE